jgi:hypothetical protein
LRKRRHASSPRLDHCHDRGGGSDGQGVPAIAATSAEPGTISVGGPAESARSTSFAPAEQTGPWYYGNTAYGFHIGQASCGFLWAATFDLCSRVTCIDDPLGVTVKTA